MAATSNSNNERTIKNDSIRVDGALLNVLTGMGVPGRDRSTVTTVKSKRKTLTKVQKEALFAVRLIRKICSVFPSEGVRKGWTIKLGGDTQDTKTIAEFNKYQNRLKIKSCLSWCKVLANAYDGAVIVINVDDGQPPSEPIRKDKISTIKDLYVLDRYKISPQLLSFNPINPDYYKLTFLRGSSYTSSNFINEYQIHPDRIIRFNGVDLLPDQMMENQGWGGSVIEQIWDSFNLWDSSHQAIAEIINNFDVMVYGLKGLAALIAGGEEGAIRKRLDTLRQTNSIYGGIAIDAESETLNSYTRNVSGLSGLGDMFRDRLIGESEVSHTYLFGESPSGLGATGESEEKTDAKKVHSFQEETYRPALDQLFELIWLAKDSPTKGKIPDDWSYEFDSLLDEKVEDKVNTRNSQSNTDRTYLDSGILLPEEVRQSRFGGSEYSFETILDEELWRKKQEEEQNQFSGFDAFGGSDDNSTADDSVEGAESAQPFGDPAEEVAAAQATTDSRFDAVFADEELHQKAINAAKRKFKVFPSRYATFFMTKEYKRLYAEKHGSMSGAFK